MKDSGAALGLLILRLAFGLGIARHGYGKVFEGGAGKMVDAVGTLGFPLPLVFAWAAALSEFAGGLLMALGLATRGAAAFVATTMGVAAFMFHAHDPIDTKEKALAYFAAALTVLCTGPGPLSLDRLLSKSKS
jgi:putative oxidoreductase